MFSSFSSSVFLTGLTLSLSLIMAIGAQNMHVLRQGLRREHVAAVVAVCALLDVALMAVGVSGLAASLVQYPQVLDALGLLGALVLVVYGAQALRRAVRPGTLQANAGGGAVPVGRMVAQTLSLSLLNPHVYLDTVVLVGAVGAQQPLGTQGAFLLGAGGGSVLWFVVLGFGARMLRPLFAKPMAWRLLDLLVAGMMWSIAAGLVARSLHL
ncbi:amino acid transporter [Rhodoferax sp. TH121]|uniref:LysE/ArgO family amino acid transporter n=1 Tax=Rhodoferax sp. TH121 TaxID=2022803 RepID=UPI000B973FE3|nr:LysE family transporter [Rhodoferax sp. TH121]OYQ40042.1 amino acid transporter [Rhodoferax sp. TH121]